MSVFVVAVIGAGMAGSAAAYFLSDLESGMTTKLSIDLIEIGNRTGGRVYALPFRGSKYEAGGSILHSSNQYAVSLSQKLGLKRRKSDKSSLMGIFDGERFVFEESDWEVVTLFRIAHRYGMDVLRMQAIINSMLRHFSQIYVYQKRGVSFRNVRQLLSAMSYKFPDMLQKHFYEHLKNMSMSDVTIDELVQAISLVNYGQPVRQLHAFVGAVSSAGADFAGTLWSIDGGNEQLVHRLAQQSNARLLLQTDVREIELVSDGTYALRDGNANQMIYDSVVIAHPLSMSGITFRGFPDSTNKLIAAEKQMGKYHRTVASFVSGTRSANFTSPHLNDVVVCRDGFFFQSISKVTPVSGATNSENVYKIFSPEPLNPEQMAALFDRVDEVHVVDWRAYPDYRLLDQQTPHFVLHSGLFYVNAIEWAASAMEMSLIGAKNAALLTREFLSARK